MILVDTQILIDILCGDKQKADLLTEINPTPSITSITAMKLLEKSHSKKELNHLNKFISLFIIIYPNENISYLAFKLSARYAYPHHLCLERAFISATAISNNLALLTSEKEKYDFIDGLRIYK
jgi:predicted nucleic acid-binding protein